VLRRHLHGIVAIVSTLAALVLAHDVIYLVRYQSAYGEALAHAGHGVAWTGAVGGVLVVAAGLATAGLVQLRRLSLEARGSAGGHSADPGLTFVRGWLRSSAGIAVIAAALLTVQENLERIPTGMVLPGVTLLVSPEYPFGLAIVAIVALVVGFVVALFRRRRDLLLARIAERSRPATPATAPRRSQRDDRRPAWTRGRGAELRAPPSLSRV
jgi:hypothetical protein